MKRPYIVLWSPRRCFCSFSSCWELRSTIKKTYNSKTVTSKSKVTTKSPAMRPENNSARKSHWQQQQQQQQPAPHSPSPSPLAASTQFILGRPARNWFLSIAYWPLTWRSASRAAVLRPVATSGGAANNASPSRALVVRVVWQLVCNERNGETGRATTSQINLPPGTRTVHSCRPTSFLILMIRHFMKKLRNKSKRVKKFEAKFHACNNLLCNVLWICSERTAKTVNCCIYSYFV